MNIDITARDFKVIKDKFGDMRLDSDLRITGELTKPRIEGELGITSGVINLDPVLDLVAGGAAATTQTAYATVSDPVDRPGTEPKPSLFDALRMDVHLTVANGFVIRSNDLAVPNAPIGLGACSSAAISTPSP